MHERRKISRWWPVTVTLQSSWIAEISKGEILMEGKPFIWFSRVGIWPDESLRREDLRYGRGLAVLPNCSTGSEETWLARFLKVYVRAHGYVEHFNGTVELWEPRKTTKIIITAGTDERGKQKPSRPSVYTCFHLSGSLAQGHNQGHSQ